MEQQAESTEAQALRTRYSDAYLVAKMNVGFGSLLKGIGIGAASIIALLSLLVAITAKESVFSYLGLMGVVFGCFVGILLYFLGVLISAQGQVLQAGLDSAVNSSPFLTNEQRAEIMSLSTPEPTSATLDNIHF